MLSEELDRELDSAARHLGDKKSAIVSKALSFYLDYLDLDLAKERARKYERGEDKGLSAEQLRTELGL
jgi:predicted DNA-binding protein